LFENESQHGEMMVYGKIVLAPLSEGKMAMNE
jgi:hypothetical protein